MLGREKLMAFAAIRDGARARQFYERILGLSVISEDNFVLVLDANGTMLRLQKVENFTPSSFTALGWEVSNIRSAVSELMQRGVIFQKYPWMDQDELGIWAAPSGAHVAWFKDPDGNTLSLTEF
jgi:catechol 2,3-dioxygenase-like lactoylglutathione lyase family enzyme